MSDTLETTGPGTVIKKLPLSNDEIAVCISERRMLFVAIDEQQIVLFLNQWQYPKRHLRLDCNEIPANAYVNGVHYEPQRRGLVVHLLHPSFEPSAPCSEIPFAKSIGRIYIDTHNATPGASVNAWRMHDVDPTIMRDPRPLGIKLDEGAAK